MRKNKETGDNLGEEMLAVCLHVLVKLPEEEGKFCVITDDKGATGKIDASFRRVNRRYRGKRVILFSTPKLVQALYNEGIAAEAEELLPILHAGNNGIIKILGAEIYDIDNREITLDCAEAARKIGEKKINIAIVNRGHRITASARIHAMWINIIFFRSVSFIGIKYPFLQ